MTHRLVRAAILGLAILIVTAGAVVAASAAMQRLHGGGRSLDAPVDAAIVLGAGVRRDGTLHTSSIRRVEAGVALLRSGAAEQLIMSGGPAERLGGSVAALMRDHAVLLGARPETVLVEGAAATTFENIRFSFDIARRTGLDRLAVVTDDSHLLRAALLACYFEECEISTVAVPERDGRWLLPSARDIGRETLAWWYNLGKVAAWTALGAAGIPEDRRGHYVR